MGRWDRNKRFFDPQGRGMAPGKRVSTTSSRTGRVQNKSESICLIVNPKAGAGRAGQRRMDLEREVARTFSQWEIRETQRAGHGEELAAQAVAEGFDLVAAVGGDGTCHEVVNGMMQAGVGSGTAFCAVPFGTGSDLVKTIDVPDSLKGALWLAATGVTLPVDVGHVTLNRNNQVAERFFINVAGFGAQGDIVDRSNQMSKRLGGRLTFLQATVASALRYQPRRMVLELETPDGAMVVDQTLLSCFVANGQYCGGGMWVARGASMSDGWFDVTLIPPTPLVRQVRDLRHLYDGWIERMSGARRVLASRIRVHSPDAPTPTLVDLDGEASGTLASTFEVRSKSLHVRGGWLRAG